MNEVCLVGRLTADPELKQSGEHSYCRFTVAVDRRGQEGADFIPCVTFGKTAEGAAQWLKKGVRVALDGRISTSSYTDKDGQKRNSWSVSVRSWEFAQSKNEGHTESAEMNAAGVPGFENVGMDIQEELPFK